MSKRDDDIEERTRYGVRDPATMRRPRTPAAGVSILSPVTWDDATDPQAPLVDRLEHRQKKMTAGMLDVHDRVGRLEGQVFDISVTVARGDGKLDALVAAAEASSEERKRRAEADHELARTRLKMRPRVIPAIFTGIGLLLTGLGALLAKVLG